MPGPQQSSDPHAYWRGTAVRIAAGVHAWLAAIPSELWTLFGAGYLGYGAMRSVEKVRGVTK